MSAQRQPAATRSNGDGLVRQATADVDASARSTRLSVGIGRALGTVVVTLRGSLDREDGPRLRAALRDLIEHQGNRTVVVDLHELKTLDLMGVRVFGIAAGWARRRGASFRLADPSFAVGRVLRRAGLADLVLLSRTTLKPRPRPAT